MEEIVTLKEYDHVCIIFGHKEPNIEEFEAMYSKIDTDDEGDVTIRKVVEHIRAVEAGSGNNEWVNNKLDNMITEYRGNTHVELEEFLAIIGDIQEAGWSVKVPRENEQISDQDLKNIFDKVDRNRDLLVNRMELRLACKFLCKQFEIDVKKEGELYKFIIESDNNNDGVLDFQEFKAAIKLAQKKLKESEGE